MVKANPLTRAKRRAIRIAEGMCPLCPNKIVDGKSACSNCLEKSRIRTIKLRKRKVSSGICGRCNRPSINGTTHCQEHIDYLRDFRVKKINSGVCAYCRTEERIPNKTYCKSCKDKRIEEREIKKEKGICTGMGCNNLAAINHTQCKVCSEKYLALRKALKEKVMIHYGHKCNCGCGCQVANINHLTIDHINNDGHIHRKQLGTKVRGGQAFYRWIVKNNFPKDLQILCWNCNCAKEFYGGCK